MCNSKHGKAQNTGEHGNPPNTAHRIEQHTRRDRAHAHCTESSTRCIERTNDHHVRDTDRARESKYRKQTEHSNKQLAETHKGAHHVRINGTQGYTERVEKSVRMIHITQPDTGTDRRNHGTGNGYTERKGEQRTEWTTRENVRGTSIVET